MANGTNGLVMRGMAPITRLSDTRRLVLLSASRATEIEARFEQVKQRRADEERKLQRLFDDRKIELLKELQDANLGLAATASKLSAVTEKMFLVGAVRSQIGRGGTGDPELTIIRKVASDTKRLAASEETELLPKDLIEITLLFEGQDDRGTRQRQEVKERVGALPY